LNARKIPSTIGTQLHESVWNSISGAMADAVSHLLVLLAFLHVAGAVVWFQVWRTCLFYELTKLPLLLTRKVPPPHFYESPCDVSGQFLCRVRHELRHGFSPTQSWHPPCCPWWPVKGLPEFEGNHDSGQFRRGIKPTIKTFIWPSTIPDPPMTNDS
jgi:hypothetical protein